MSDRGKQRARDDIACSAKKAVARAQTSERARRSHAPAAPSLSISHGPRRIAFAGAALFSAGLHAAAFAACLTWSKPPSLGAVELSMDVVSIELAPSPVLEAQPKIEPQEPAPSTASVAPTEGNAEADAEPERAREAPQPEEPKPEPPVEPPKVKTEPAAPAPEEPKQAETEPEAAVPQEPQQAVADAEALPAGPMKEKEKQPQVEPPAKPDPKQEEAKREPREEEEKPKRETRRTRKGGVTSRARSGKGSGSSRASASAGSILRYASYVRARVARNKPSGSGLRGTAAIAFGVTRSGGLAYARIRRSSGSAVLDRLALGAVRGAAPFPRPPAGARPGQLRFSIAIHFR
jgi:protein TonB